MLHVKAAIQHLMQLGAASQSNRAQKKHVLAVLELPGSHSLFLSLPLDVVDKFTEIHNNVLDRDPSNIVILGVLAQLIDRSCKSFHRRWMNVHRR